MDESPSRTLATDAAQQRLNERVGAIESVLVAIPVMLVEVLLLISLFTPFVSTVVSEREETVNFFGLVGGLFSPASDGDSEASGIVFGVAFLVLILVIIGTMIVIPLIARSLLRGPASGTVTAFTVLLLLGTAGAWLVTGIGVNSNDTPWTMGPALPLLTAAALISALIVFLPAYRSIWAH